MDTKKDNKIGGVFLDPSRITHGPNSLELVQAENIPNNLEITYEYVEKMDVVTDSGNIYKTYKEKKYKYSEIFGKTIQGEGKYTGAPTVWIRFWGCNFECNGFGQDNPEDKSSYILPYQTIDVSSIKRMEDLPVFHTGCDSSYSWSKKYSHLAHSDSVTEICNKLENFLRSEHNPEGKFLHPKTGQWTHMAFTGGEPMMNQYAIIDILKEFSRRKNYPAYITIETNGTQDAELGDGRFFNYFYIPREKENTYISEFKNSGGKELFWSVSPKLYLSGENKEDALRSDVVQKYYTISSSGQLKYVSDGSDRSWKEVEEFTEEYKTQGIDWPVWIMPVGADIEGQNKIAAKVTEAAVDRGYNVAARVHTYIFGNVVGK